MIYQRILQNLRMLLLVMTCLVASATEARAGAKGECTGFFARLLKYQALNASESLLRIGSAKQEALPKSGVRVLLWNAHKHSHASWSEDFSKMRNKADIFLLQEVAESPLLDSALGSMAGKEWMMAQSYQAKNFSTGVATGSDRRSVRTEAVRSPIHEPLLRTPKSSVVSEFAIRGRAESLMVVNVHAINFTNLQKFKTHLSALLPYIEKHQGPILVAGDMNTWSPGRANFLREMLAEHGLSEAVAEGAPRMLNLDRAFVRGMKMKKGEVMNEVRSSDHKPLYFEFEFNQER